MNGPLVVARGAQIASLGAAAGCALAIKAQRPLLLAGFVAGLLFSLTGLLLANLARRSDDPRPHPPGCTCPHERNH